MEKVYNYDILKKRIKQHCHTQKEFASYSNISATSLNNKLNNKSYFTQDEINKIIKMFNLTAEEAMAYFFTTEVDFLSTN